MGLHKSESEITRDICQYLEMRHIPYSVTNASAGVRKRRRCSVGLRKGWPDIVGCLPWSGRFLGIEVKAEKGKLSKDQEEALEELRNAGGVVIVARRVGDVSEVING